MQLTQTQPKGPNMFGMFKAAMKLPVPTKIWMGVMMLVFTAHLPYVTNELHRASAIAFFLTAIAFGNISFAMSRNVNSLAAAHFILWPAMLLNAVHTHVTVAPIDLSGFQGAVLLAGYGVFLVSLALDYKLIMNAFRVAATD